MPIPAITPCLVGCTTVTVGTGDYILTANALPAPFSHPFFVLNDGQQVFLTVTDQVSYEHGIYTYHAAGGPYGSFSRTTITSSSTAPNATRTTNPINWGAAGTRSLFSDVPETGFMLAGNNGSDIANVTSFKNNLGLGTAATLNVGTSANQVVQLTAAGKYPAVDGSLITNLPAQTPFPSGTKMPFYQAAAPPGWTMVTGINDKLFYITDGSGGNPAGGTNNTGVSGTPWDGSYGLTVQGHTITIAEMPSHTHDAGAVGQAFVITGPGSATSGTGGSLTTLAGSNPTAAAGGGGSHTHGIISSAIYRPPGAFMIVASKN